jgi:hypothetical protein
VKGYEYGREYEYGFGKGGGKIVYEYGKEYGYKGNGRGGYRIGSRLDPDSCFERMFIMCFFIYFVKLYKKQ